MKNVVEKNRTKGIQAGIICFSVFMTPWLILALLAWITAPEGFKGETLASFLIGYLVFLLLFLYF
jgi:hypothetical protein